MTSPLYRAIDALAKPGADIPAVLAAANELSAMSAECDGLRAENAGLRCRVDELAAEVAELRAARKRMMRGGR